MSEREIERGEIAFETEGRLLEELGERLVASPEVALVELIKNAYDADSPTCNVTLDEDDTKLVVEDRGHGMTLDDFKNKWMRIATSSKLEERKSPRFERRLTGAKGIGRFAVRYLGSFLRLESVAFDRSRKCKTRLIANFDWPKLDAAPSLHQARIPWELLRIPSEAITGTKLVVGRLKTSTAFTRQKSLRTEVLRIVSPLSGLESGKFKLHQGGKDGDEDPGFAVTLPGEEEASQHDLNLAKAVLNHYWARLTIAMDKGQVRYNVHFGSSGRRKTLRIRTGTDISAGLHGDIRFFPRRAGVFAGTEIDGREAWHWVRQNCGIAVVDHGFRIKPYGFPDDDWLHLDIDKARSERDWRTGIMKESFPITEERRKKPALNPMLYLPYNLQLVGAVFVESRPASVSKQETDLVPSMDREGFLRNPGFVQLVEVVRAGIEFLALCDKEEVEVLENENARAAAAATRRDFRKAIEFFEKSQTLAPKDKARVIAEYSELARRFEEQERYHRQAQQNLNTMSLLGVVAGFMTHESRAMVARLEETVELLKGLSKRHPEVRLDAAEVEKSLGRLKEHLDYTSLFVDATQHKRQGAFAVAPQVEMIVERFGNLAKERGIRVDYDIPDSLKTPILPVAAYSGILLNLFTNAIKAVIAAPAINQQPCIRFKICNDTQRHIVEVADNGVGIPPEIRERIWDPLFTTTSNLNNPLGSGMGLGLSLVERLVHDLGGQIALMEKAPNGFSTCFRITFPLKNS
jgi:signal transduction histidine kinase